MEIKTKHRILGVLVVVGLIIILFPFFQNAKDMQADASSVKAPPFPDQSVQVSTNSAVSLPVQQQAEPQTLPIVNTNDSSASNDNGMRETPDDVITATQPTIINQPKGTKIDAMNEAVIKSDDIHPARSLKTSVSNDEDEGSAHSDLSGSVKSLAVQEPKSEIMDDQADATLAENDASDDAAKSAVKAEDEAAAKPVMDSEKKSTATKRHAPSSKKAVHIIKQTSSVKSKLAAVKTLDADGLFKLKSSAFVIQIGSFKNKTNALRMVNQLRASGYRAFIQQYSSNTRVFVGPEVKQVSARELANKLESDLHIKGVVISYKPLTL